MRNRLINCNFYNVQRKLKKRCVDGSHRRVKKAVLVRRPHECSVSIEILNLPEFNIPWHRRGPLSLLLFWIFLTGCFYLTVFE